jgi:hypothetical protein
MAKHRWRDFTRYKEQAYPDSDRGPMFCIKCDAPSYFDGDCDHMWNCRKCNRPNLTECPIEDEV